MNGSRLIAGCFRFIFGSHYAESTRSKFGVSACSRINTVVIVCHGVNTIKLSQAKISTSEVIILGSEKQ